MFSIVAITFLHISFKHLEFYTDRSISAFEVWKDLNKKHSRLTHPTPVEGSGKVISSPQR